MLQRARRLQAFAISLCVYLSTNFVRINSLKSFTKFIACYCFVEHNEHKWETWGISSFTNSFIHEMKWCDWAERWANWEPVAGEQSKNKNISFSFGCVDIEVCLANCKFIIFWHRIWCTFPVFTHSTHLNDRFSNQDTLYMRVNRTFAYCAFQWVDE